MKNYTKPVLCQNMDTKFENVNALCSGGKDKVCAPHSQEHPTLYWCGVYFQCPNFYTEGIDARCTIRDSFDFDY